MKGEAIRVLWGAKYFLPPTSKYQYSNDIICRAVKNENFLEIFRKLDFSQPFFRSPKQLIQAQIIC